MNELSSNKAWYVLYTKPQQEFKAKEQISSVDIECFLPTQTVLKQWHDRKKKIIEPVFRGYIFINSTPKERFIALEQQSVVSTIAFMGVPAKVPQHEIDSLKSIIESGDSFFVTTAIKNGTKVRIIDGPFKDVVGIVYKNEEKDDLLAVTVEMLNRSVNIRLPLESVRVKLD